MNRATAAVVLLLLSACTAAALVAPLEATAALLGLGLLVAPRRRAILALGATSLAFNVLLFGFFGPGAPLAIPGLGGLHWRPQGALTGLGATLRLTAVAAVNLGVLGRIPIERVLDGLLLPPRVAGTLAALALCARDVGRDAARLLDAARLDGEWPRRAWRRVLAAAGLVPALIVLSMRRAETRREALQLAGIHVAPAWTPVVAVGALALAGRFATLAVPNVAFTFVIVFLGGILFGARIGALAGFLAMLASDFLLTGLQPTPLVNAPAMALLGLLGGLLRGLPWESSRPGQAWATRILAAALGIAATLVFSAASDALTWAMVPEYRSQPGALRILIAAGWAFNGVPAGVNAFLFAAATAPTVRAWRAANRIASPQAPPLRQADDRGPAHPQPSLP